MPRVRLSSQGLTGRMVRFKDLMSAANYDRNGDVLLSRGLYLDMTPWGYHVFEVSIGT